jgi:hypothetical protein
MDKRNLRPKPRRARPIPKTIRNLDVVYEALAQRLKRYTQVGIARECGLSGQMISDVIARRRMPSEPLVRWLGFEVAFVRRRTPSETAGTLPSSPAAREPADLAPAAPSDGLGP